MDGQEPMQQESPEEYPVQPGVKERAHQVIRGLPQTASLPAPLPTLLQAFLRVFERADEATIVAALRDGSRYIDFILYGAPEEG